MANSYDKCLESDLPIVGINGLNTNKNTQLNGTLGVSGAASFGSTVSFSGTASAGPLSSTGLVTAQNATAIGATGTQAFSFSTVGTFGIYYGSGAPGGAAATGSLYLRSDGSGTGSRGYISTGGTAWTAIITNA